MLDKPFIIKILDNGFHMLENVRYVSVFTVLWAE